MSKTCFVICPIGEAGSEIRRRSDQILNHIISPALDGLGYDTPIRADHISESGIVTNQIVEYITKADLVVADLTGRNPNVYYELAIRHAIRKPFIQIVEEGEDLPFDVITTRTIKLNHRDLDSVEICKAEMRAQATAGESSPDKVDSPISVAVSIQSLRQNSNPVELASHDIVSRLESIQYTLSELLNHKLDTQLEESFTIFGDKLLSKHINDRYVDKSEIKEDWQYIAMYLAQLVDCLTLVEDIATSQAIEPLICFLCTHFRDINKVIGLNNAETKKIIAYGDECLPF